MIKLLIVGSESQVGVALIEALENKVVEFDALPYSDALLLNVDELSILLTKSECGYVINVDHFDGFITEPHNQKELEQHHLTLPQNLAKACEKNNTPLIQLSDCQVFSGLSDLPYSEKDEPHAKNMYGITRWQGEVLVQRFTRRYIILRVGTVFSNQGENILTSLLSSKDVDATVEFSTNVLFSPTPASDIARVIYAIVQQLDCDADAWGLYHYCSADVATPYDFAEVTLAARNQFLDCDQVIDLKPVKSESDDKALNQVLVCKKLLDGFGIRQRPWRSELTRCVESLS